MKVIITKKGTELKTNRWVVGQEIECHENIGKKFIERGLAIDPNNVIEVKEEEVKQIKTKKK